MTQSLALAMLATYFGAVLLLVAAMIASTRRLGERRIPRATAQPVESGMLTVGDARVPFPAQFYLVAMFFVIFDLEAVFIYAWAVAARETGWAGYAEVMVFVAVLLAALVYLSRTGALDWTPPRSRPRRAREAPAQES